MNMSNKLALLWCDITFPFYWMRLNMRANALERLERKEKKIELAEREAKLKEQGIKVDVDDDSLKESVRKREETTREISRKIQEYSDKICAEAAEKRAKEGKAKRCKIKVF